MTLWVRWKKRKMSVIELDPKDAENAQDLDDGITGNTSGWRCHLTASLQSFLKAVISLI